MPAVTETGTTGTGRPPRSAWLGQLLRRLVSLTRRDPFAFAGVAIYVIFGIVAIFADVVATHDPLTILFDSKGRLAACLFLPTTIWEPQVWVETFILNSSTAREARSSSASPRPSWSS